jgi:hypothetical protein
MLIFNKWLCASRLQEPGFSLKKKLLRNFYSTLALFEGPGYGPDQVSSLA